MYFTVSLKHHKDKTFWKAKIAENAAMYLLVCMHPFETVYNDMVSRYTDSRTIYTTHVYIY